MPKNTIYVGRGTPFGNPYVIRETEGGAFNVAYLSKSLYLLIAFAIPKDMAHKLAVKKYKEGIDREMKAKIKKQLAGKNLACWCNPGDICHADILLKIANQ